MWKLKNEFMCIVFLYMKNINNGSGSEFGKN